MKNYFKITFIVLICLIAAFIWANSVVPASESQQQSDGIKDFLEKLFTNNGTHPLSGLGAFIINHIRKIAHFAEYFVLGVLLEVFLLGGSHEKPLVATWNSVAISVCVAVIDESIQLFSGRGAMVRDILLDTAGACTAVLIVLSIRMIYVGLKRGKVIGIKEFQKK